MSDQTLQARPLGSTPRIHHIALSVADLQGSAQWYKEKLGFTEAFHIDQWIDEDTTPFPFHMMLTCGGFFIELLHVPDAAGNVDAFVPVGGSAAVRGYIHGSFFVEDAYETLNVLAERGVQVQRNEIAEDLASEAGMKIAWFWDYEGNLYQLLSGDFQMEAMQGQSYVYDAATLRRRV